MIVPLFVGRDKSVRALEDVMQDDKQILLVTQKNAGDDDPAADEIYDVGTIGTVLQLLKLPDGTVKVLVEGGRRARITRYVTTDNFFEAEAVEIEEDEGEEQEQEAPVTRRGYPVRAVHQAQQEDSAGGLGLGQSDRGAGEAGGHHRLPFGAEDFREAGVA